MPVSEVWLVSHKFCPLCQFTRPRPRSALIRRHLACVQHILRREGREVVLSWPEDARRSKCGDLDDNETYKKDTFVVGASRTDFEDNHGDLNLVLESEEDSDKYIPQNKPECSEDDSDEFTSPKKRINTYCLKNNKGKNKTKRRNTLRWYIEQEEGHLEEVIDETEASNTVPSIPSSKQEASPAPSPCSGPNAPGINDDGSQDIGSGCMISVTAGEVRKIGTSSPCYQVVPRSGGLVRSRSKSVAVPCARKVGGSRSSSVFHMKTGGRHQSGEVARMIGGSILPEVAPLESDGLLGSGSGVVARKIGEEKIKIIVEKSKSPPPVKSPVESLGAKHDHYDDVDDLLGDTDETDYEVLLSTPVKSTASNTSSPISAASIRSSIFPEEVAPFKTDGVIPLKPCREHFLRPGEASVKTMGPVRPMGRDQAHYAGESSSGGSSQEQTSDAQDVKENCRLSIIRHLSRSLEKTEQENERLRRLLIEVTRPIEQFRRHETKKVIVQVIEID